MSPSMGRNPPTGQLVNLDMEKKPFCWFEEMENKYCSYQHQESMWIVAGSTENIGAYVVALQ